VAVATPLGQDEWQRPSEEPAEIEAEPEPEVADADDEVSEPAEWVLPTLELFREHAAQEVSEADLSARSRVIEETLASFNIEARVVEVNHGPAVTQFGVEP